MRYILLGLSLILLSGCSTPSNSITLTQDEFRQLTYEWSLYRQYSIYCYAKGKKINDKEAALFLRRIIDLDLCSVRFYGLADKFSYLYTRYLHDKQLGIRSIDPSYNE